MDKPRIGFIGVGIMGHGMAKNLVITTGSCRPTIALPPGDLRVGSAT